MALVEPLEASGVPDAGGVVGAISLLAGGVQPNASRLKPRTNKLITRIAFALLLIGKQVAADVAVDLCAINAHSKYSPRRLVSTTAEILQMLSERRFWSCGIVLE